MLDVKMFIPCLIAYIGISLTNGSLLGPKIGGGQEATKGQFPWLVRVEASNFQEDWPLCAGILITQEWVLTAAHCLDWENPAWLWVVTGEHDTEVDEGTEQHLYVDYFVQHPEYTYLVTPYVNDVGLIHLTSPATIDDFTGLAPLPNDGTDTIEGPCTEAGWGVTSEGTPGATILQYSTVPLLTPQDCETAYFTALDPNALCAGEMNGGAGFCAGDNGGGLYCWSPFSGRNVVGGIMSWREGCALPGKPALYMDVAKYRDWILSVINA